MLHDWAVIAAAFGYIGFLFFVASRGNRRSPKWPAAGSQTARKAGIV